MTAKSRTILFFGTEDFSLESLKALHVAGYNIGAVITKPDARRGRGSKVNQPLVKQYSLKHGIDVWQPDDIRQLESMISSFDSPAGVLVSYGKIIPESIIRLFHPGIINVHPSLLPIYRGPTPIESAIINGDNETGVSIMQLSKKMDAGPVYSQVKHPLNKTETSVDLYSKLAEIGANELTRVLPDILDGNLHPQPQDDSQASYCTLLSKDGAYFRHDILTAYEVERKIRAHIRFPKTKFEYLGDQIIITKAHPVNQKSSMTIPCANDTLLQIDEIIAPSGKTMPFKSYLNGKRQIK